MKGSLTLLRIPMNQLLSRQPIKQPNMMSFLIGCRTMNISKPGIAGASCIMFFASLEVLLACWIGRNTRSGIVSCLLSRVSGGLQQLKIWTDLLCFQTYITRLVPFLIFLVRISSHLCLQSIFILTGVVLFYLPTFYAYIYRVY